MLTGLLSKEECAECRLCCSFESYDLLDTPTVTRAAASRILQEFLPEQKFIRRGECFLMKMQPLPDRDLYLCPLLDPDRGCIMGDGKPFECRIWPLRVMKRGNETVIALSPVCPVVRDKPRELIRKKCAELSALIFAEAERCPELARPYCEGFEVFEIMNGEVNGK